MTMKSYRRKTRQAYMYSWCPGSVSKRVPLHRSSWRGLWRGLSYWDSLESLGQGRTNTRRQVAPVAKFSTVAPNAGGSSVRNLFPVTLLAWSEVASRYLGNLWSSVLEHFYSQTSLSLAFPVILDNRCHVQYWQSRGHISVTLIP